MLKKASGWTYPLDDVVGTGGGDECRPFGEADAVEPMPSANVTVATRDPRMTVDVRFTFSPSNRGDGREAAEVCIKSLSRSTIVDRPQIASSEEIRLDSLQLEVEKHYLAGAR